MSIEKLFDKGIYDTKTTRNNWKQMSKTKNDKQIKRCDVTSSTWKM